MTEEGLAVWTGSCSLGTANGDGVASYEDNYIRSITGEMVGGTPTGIIRIDYKRGGYYVGTLRDGQHHGFGLDMEPWGEGYEGHWVDGFRHGEGVYIHTDGRRIPGVWRKRFGLVSSWYVDAKTGCKISLAPDSNPIGEASWMGECREGKAQGTGIVSWSTLESKAPLRSNITFTGELIDGVLSGKGVWVQVDEFSNVIQTKTIKAIWKNGEVNGYGKEIRESNFIDEGSFNDIYRSYEGQYKSGAFSGNGRLEEIKTYVDGKIDRRVKEGQFSNNFLQGVGIITHDMTFSSGDNNHEETEGQFEKNKFTGPGRKFQKSTGGPTMRVTFEGDVSDGGEGTISYANGDKFSGEIGYYGDPRNGYCDFPSVEFSGECRSQSKNTSNTQGSVCLVPVKKPNECLLLISG